MGLRPLLFQKIKDKPTQKTLLKFQDAVQNRLKKAGLAGEVSEVTGSEVTESEVTEVTESEKSPVRSPKEESVGSPTPSTEADSTEPMCTDSPSTVTCTTTTNVSMCRAIG